MENERLDLDSNVSNSEADQEQEKSEYPFDVETLKSVSERAGQTYDDKYQTALFEVNFEMAPNEQAEIHSLIESAKTAIEPMKAQEAYQQLEALYKEGSNKGVILAFVREAYYRILVEDPSLANPVKILDAEGKAAIATPPELKHIFIWDRIINSVESTLTKYETGQARGTMAKGFGEDIKEVFRFVKETWPKET